MTALNLATLLQQGTQTLHGLPEGYDAFVLATYAREVFDRAHAPLVQCVSDDLRLDTLQQTYALCAPDVRVLPLPAWDCLPYDRVSPQTDILAQRAATLVAIAQGIKQPTIILTTLAAVAQKIPSLSYFAQSSLQLKQGATISREALQAFLLANGYERTDTVREQGYFALRGSICDLFPSNFEQPLRLDFFDDELEQLKFFDPISQRSLEETSNIILTPTSELLLNPQTVARFREQYRTVFGGNMQDDPLYLAISEGRRYPGMEHWLPLFYEHMTDLPTALPNAVIVQDHQAATLLQARQTQVADYYAARVETANTKGGTNYKPLPPHFLYLEHIDLSGRVVRELSPFVGNNGAQDLGGQISPRFNATQNVYEQFSERLIQAQKAGQQIVLACYSLGARERVQKLLSEHGVENLVATDEPLTQNYLKAHTKHILLAIWPLSQGFKSPNLWVMTEEDIFGDRLSRHVRKKGSKDAIFNTAQLSEGDYVVHIEHGVGQFMGLIKVSADGADHDCLKIIYADDAKLFVPVENINVLSRYGSDQATVQLDRLGGAGWQARKARVKKRLLDMAEGLLALAAKRLLQKAPEMTVPDGTYQEFCARFPYQETEDQQRAIDDVLGDLHEPQAMDRLVCGDVGFGKTEVAMRAAFVAAMSGLQVAVVVPTTLLARQHYNNFAKRFQGFPLRVAQLSRMVTTVQAKKNLENLANGQVDIIVGTHALLAESVKFSNLGLLIVDEEQNFGVKQKERLKNLQENIHVLTLTATPIPRTLQLAMTGLRQMSIIATPPVDRLAVKTFIMPHDPVIIREALMREHYRGGQSFYVCPRISDLEKIHAMLQELVPEIKIIEAHGQMTATELDERMNAFYDGQYDVLLATNIIESGLDIPNANTLIVHRADLFGLGQLYQVRGRIGRSKRRAYAYLTYQDEKLLSANAKQRLQVMATLDQLGAGFQLASYDLDIRGAGNLLGDQQSGHIREVGVELYQQMLAEAVAQVKAGVGEAAESVVETWTPHIQLGLPVLIPDEYVPDLPVRLGLYRRLSELVSEEAIDAFAAELSDRFGPLPEPVKNLLDILVIKQDCLKAHIAKFDAGPKGAILSFYNNNVPYVDKLMAFIQSQLGQIKIRPDQKLVYVRQWEDVALRVAEAKKLIKKLADMAHS